MEKKGDGEKSDEENEEKEGSKEKSKEGDDDEEDDAAEQEEYDEEEQEEVMGHSGRVAKVLNLWWSNKESDMWYIIKMLNKNQVDGNQGSIIIHGIKSLALGELQHWNYSDTKWNVGGKSYLIDSFDRGSP